MLPCVCSVVDHRWRKNVVITKKWHTRWKSSVSLMFLPHFDVFCDLLLNRRRATLNLFVLYNKETNYTTEKAFSLFQNLSTWLESRPLPCTPPTLTNTEKAIWRNLLSIQMKQSYWLLCVAKNFSLVQENHATVKLDSSIAPRGIKTYPWCK